MILVDIGYRSVLAGVAPPVLIGLTLTGIKGWKALRGPEYWGTDDAGPGASMIGRSTVCST